MEHVAIYNYPGGRRDVVGPFETHEAAGVHAMAWLKQDNRAACGWWFEVEPIISPEEA